MLTRCPTCTTTFRVTPEQLKARLGRVRCGQCQAVFNALDSLVEEVPTVPAAVAPSVVSAVPATPTPIVPPTTAPTPQWTAPAPTEPSQPVEPEPIAEPMLAEAPEPESTAPTVADPVEPSTPTESLDLAEAVEAEPDAVETADVDVPAEEITLTELEPFFEPVAEFATELPSHDDAPALTTPLPYEPAVVAEPHNDAANDSPDTPETSDAAETALPDAQEAVAPAPAEASATVLSFAPSESLSPTVEEGGTETVDPVAATTALESIAPDTDDTAPAEPLAEAAVAAEVAEESKPVEPAETETTEASSPDTEAEPTEQPDNNAIPAPDPLLHYAPHRARRWPWAVGCLLAGVALLFQLVLHYRVEIATLNPGLKPTLQALCEPLDCTVPLPHKIDLLSIETSDLHPGSQKGQLQLVASLKNKAPFAQEYPLLEVTLTDVADRTLIVKSLQPAEYLTKDFKPEDGFPARKEIAVNLTLAVGDVPAAGYRLYLYHP